MKNFYYEGNSFILNGEKFSLRSGAMHYFRIPKAYWKDRLLKLKECGFNCVETYLAWNIHEYQEGQFNFSDSLDFGEFLDLADRLGLLAIVRPGPYICAEWEGGGLPSWLFASENIKVRCNNKKYLFYAERYLKKTFEYIRPRLITNGGNIIMVQVENEYGSFGNDKTYLERLVRLHKNEGIDCLLFTSDGAGEMAYWAGNTKDCLPFFNFGSRIREQMSVYDKLNLSTPRVCAEFWAGWFDHWGEPHHIRPKEEIIECISDFIKLDYGFNMYMFHGGTNFGFTNGCNYYSDKQGLKPTVTSYDYCAPLNEAGDRTETYYAIRNLFIEQGIDVPPLTAKDSEKRAYGKVNFVGAKSLFSAKGEIGYERKSTLPLSMEECKQNNGYILYSTKIFGGCKDDHLFLDNVGDRAIVFIDGKKVGVYQYAKTEDKIIISTPKGKDLIISVLVENLGRVNYGPHVYDKKGLGGIRVYTQFLHGIENWSLPMDDLEGLSFDNLTDLDEYAELPSFFKGIFTVDKPCDTFLRLDGFRKGFAVVNGFNLGRYYEIGPQKTLYVPSCVLKEGENQLIVFDSDGVKGLDAEFVAIPEL